MSPITVAEFIGYLFLAIAAACVIYGVVLIVRINRDHLER